MIRPIDEWQFDLTFYIAAIACVGAGIFFHLPGHHRRAREASQLCPEAQVLALLRAERALRSPQAGLPHLRGAGSSSPPIASRLPPLPSSPSSPHSSAYPLTNSSGTWSTASASAIMLTNAVLLVIVCLGYGTAEHLGLGPKVALLIVFVTYVMDQPSSPWRWLAIPTCVR